MSLAIRSRLHLRMLNTHFDAQAPGEHVQPSFGREHHSSPFAGKIRRRSVLLRKPDISDIGHLSC